jgi:hypothetical protein
MQHLPQEHFARPNSTCSTPWVHSHGQWPPLVSNYSAVDESYLCGAHAHYQPPTPPYVDDRTMSAIPEPSPFTLFCKLRRHQITNLNLLLLPYVIVNSAFFFQMKRMAGIVTMENFKKIQFKLKVVMVPRLLLPHKAV